MQKQITGALYTSFIAATGLILIDSHKTLFTLESLNLSRSTDFLTHECKS